MSSWFVSTHSNEWPPFCACCGAAAESWPAKKLKVPLCRVCHDHLRMPLGRLLVATLAVVFWILLVCVLTGGNGPIAAILGIGGLYAVLWWAIAKRRTNPTCATKRQPPVVASMAHNGKRIFLFQSEEYARKFAAANSPATIWRRGDKEPA